MKLIVIGGSNSIISRGYIERLKIWLPNLEIVNRSIGASSSMMGYFRLASFTGLSSGDIVIWEYALNDEHEIVQDPSMHLQLALRYVEYTLRKVLLANARFLPVVLRPRWLADSSVYSLYRKGLFDLFERYGIRPVDLSALYAEIHGGADVPRSAYADPWHFQVDSEIADLIAENVADRLVEDEKNVGELREPCFCRSDNEVRIVDFFDRLPCERYVNALFSQTFFLQAPQDTLIFKPVLEWWLVGVLILASPKPGSFALRAADKSAAVNVKHLMPGFSKSLLRLRVLPAVHQLFIGPNAPLWLNGPARLGEEKLMRPVELPEQTGLVGLVLERPRPSKPTIFA